MGQLNNLTKLCIILAFSTFLIIGCGGQKKTTLAELEKELKKLESLQEQVNDQIGVLHDLIVEAQIEAGQDAEKSSGPSGTSSSKQVASNTPTPKPSTSQTDDIQIFPASDPKSESSSSTSETTDPSDSEEKEKKNLHPLADIIIVIIAIVLIFVLLKIGSNRQEELDEAESGEVVITTSGATPGASVGEVPRTESEEDSTEEGDSEESSDENSEEQNEEDKKE